MPVIQSPSKLPDDAAVADLPPKPAMDPILRDQRRSFWSRIADALFGFDFFISYSWADGGIYAAALAARLKGLGFDCFLDRDGGFVLGDNWRVVGAMALQRTSRLVLVATAGAIGSEAVQHELKLYRAKDGRVIPIDFGGVLGDALAGGHSIGRFLPQEVIRESEDEGRLTVGPSDVMLERLLVTFNSERQSAKRMRALKGVALVLAGLFLTAATLAIVAYFARERAAQNEQRARVSKNAAEGIVDHMLRDLGHKLESIGKLELLEDVTTASENYFARMDNNFRDAETETHAALASMTHGDILRQKGEHPAARAYYEKAEIQLAKLAASFPQNARTWRDLSNARGNLALAAHLADDRSGEKFWVSGTADAIAAALRIDPENPDFHRESILMRVRQMNESSPVTIWEALVEETLQLAQKHPNSSNVRLLSFVGTNAASACSEQGDLEKAAFHLNRAVLLMMKIEEILPEDAEVQLDLADSLRALAFLQKQRGRMTEAVDAMQAAESTTNSLRQRDPLNQEWLSQHAQLLSVFADFLFNANQSEMAFAKAREATSLLSAVQERHPAVRHHAVAAALALSTFGYQLAKADKWEDAVFVWMTCTSLLEKFAALERLTPEQDVTLAIGYRSLGEASLASKPPDLKKAREWIAKGITRLRALQNVGILPPSAEQFLHRWEQRDRVLAEP